MRTAIITATSALFVIILSCSSFSAETTDFTLENLEGDLVTLSDYFGQGPLLINFWATWCTPCKNELPHLQKLHEKYEDSGFVLLTIAEDSPKSQSKIKPYVKAKRFTFPVLLDPDNEILHLFQGSTLPHRVLLDSDGNIIETHQGYSQGEEILLEEQILELLTQESADE